jgi:hypothetical protein
MEKIIKKLKCDNINYNEYGELFYWKKIEKIKCLVIIC